MAPITATLSIGAQLPPSAHQIIPSANTKLDVAKPAAGGVDQLIGARARLGPRDGGLRLRFAPDRSPGDFYRLPTG